MMRDSVLQLVGDVTAVPVDALDPVVEVGAIEGPPGESFGFISDIEASPSGDIFVLDERYQRLFRFDRQGGLLDQVGEGGSGPGEFHGPTALSLYGDEGIAVLDPSQQRITVFAVDEENLMYEETISLPFFPQNFCALDHRIFVVAVHEGRLIHEIDLEGNVLRSFGAPVEMSNIPTELSRRSAQLDLSGGRILCLRGEQELVLAPRYGPKITAYSVEGTVLWSTTIADHLPLTAVAVEVGGRPGYSLRPGNDAGEYHRAVTIDRLGPETLIMQHGVLDYLHQEPGEREVITRLIDLNTGRILAKVEDLPVVASVGGEGVITMGNAPYPRWAWAELKELTEVIGL